MNSPIGGISDDEMANIYAISSFHMTCTSGEGFKLSVLEAMISGCLVAMPDYSTGEELLGEKRGLLIKTGIAEGTGGYWYGTNNYRKVVVSKKAAVEVLEKAYHYWSDKSAGTGEKTEKELYGMLKRSQGFALQWTWEKCFEQIVETMMGLYEEMPKVKVA